MNRRGRSQRRRPGRDTDQINAGDGKALALPNDNNGTHVVDQPFAQLGSSNFTWGETWQPPGQ
jgi:hypothetical protein